MENDSENKIKINIEHWSQIKKTLCKRNDEVAVAYCIVFMCKLQFITILKRRQASKVRDNRKTGDEENALPYKNSLLEIYLILRLLIHVI